MIPGPGQILIVNIKICCSAAQMVDSAVLDLALIFLLS